MSKMCMKCGYEAGDHHKFCPGCGAPLSDPRSANQAPPGNPPPGYSSPSPVSPNYPPPNYPPNQYSPPPYYSANSDSVTPDKLVIEPIIAVVLTFVLFGLGQMLNGQVGKGFALFGGQIALAFVTMGLSILPGYIFVCIDAYMCAKALKEGKTIGKWSFFGST
ncbi:MAG: zinc ribbon domain-containing protein [Clostridiaceae bacterium]|nr:zinc ribbon domain-containing protein [Oscillospiraceae bacterium]NLO63150.1 zinc ribbon domain-containing protein [Clostridiaceae bacterium]